MVSGSSAAPAKKKSFWSFFWSRNKNEVAIAALHGVQKTAPYVPGLGAACLTLAEILRAIDDAKENKKAFGDLIEEASSMIEGICRRCEAVAKEWSSDIAEGRSSNVAEGRSSDITFSQLNSHVVALNSILEEIRDTAKKKAELPAYKRFFASRTDPGLVRDYRSRMNAAVQRFQSECDILLLVASGRLESFLETRLMPMVTRTYEALEALRMLNPPQSDSPRDVVEPAHHIVAPESDWHHIPQNHTRLRNAVDSEPQSRGVERYTSPRETGPDRGAESTTLSPPSSRSPIPPTRSSDSHMRTESANLRLRPPVPSSFDGGRDPSLTTGPSSSSTYTTASYSPSSPISREDTSSNQLRSGEGAPGSRSRSSPSSTPHPPVDPSFQPQSPSPSQTSSASPGMSELP
ncbi:hypothetical protein PQX77_019001 [Marasmius sp. AFHP31]|nr:hypothetical protein PQX77_019001 [Marasmius sp. AFHP31]